MRVPGPMKRHALIIPLLVIFAVLAVLVLIGGLLG
jgi:hypothetical protein